jgi:signal transduction histidine kinase
MFRSATVKLTLSYLAIIMALCLMFSGAIYQSASQELQSNLTRQSQRFLDRYPDFDFDRVLSPETVYENSRHQIILSLVYLNIGVLIFAGFASYALARWTLRPIEEAHEQQKRFTSDVSHELRTPLTALKMTTEVALLDNASKAPSLRQTLESNLVEIVKIETLINNLLKLTRLEAEEIRDQFTAVPLKTCVDEACSGIQDLATKKVISVESRVSDTLLVLGDKASLVQLFTVFLDNALKYSPAESTVTIGAKARSGTVAVTITDQGIGIAEADIPNVFNRFYQADTARTRSDTQGFGLGLSIAKMIADLHNGSLEVQSKPGKGTTITVVLPAAKA